MDATLLGVDSVSTPPSSIITCDSTRNDNSNPQQGSGATRATMPAMSHGPGRPSLKIPPYRKDSRKLFVGGLPVDITEEEFRQFFSQFGKLMDGIVMIDRDSNRSRGFGFVSFEDPEVAKKLLSMGHSGPNEPGTPVVGRLEMRGKTIEVKAAQPRDNAPNRRHHHHQYHQYHRNDRRSTQTATPPVPVPSNVKLEDTSFAQGYDGGSSYYPYYPPPVPPGYVPSGYYPMMHPALTGDGNFYHHYVPYAYGAAYPVYDESHQPPLLSATPSRTPSIYPATGAGVKKDDRTTSAVV